MRYLIWFLAIIVLLVLQAGVFLPLNLAPMNILLVLIVVSLLFAGFNFGLGLTLVCGIMLDFVSGSHDGLISLTMISVFLSMYFMINHVLSREPSLQILFSSVAVGTLLYFLFLSVFNRLFMIFNLGSIIDYRSFFLIDFSKTLAFNLLLTYPVLKYYLFVKKLEKPHAPKPIRS